jgi:hypothetical protein
MVYAHNYTYTHMCFLLMHELLIDMHSYSQSYIHTLRTFILSEIVPIINLGLLESRFV